MSHPSRYFGIDVSKDTLVVAFERHRWQFPNSKEGHRKLIAQIRKQSGSIQVLCEATGPYHLAMCLALQAAEIPVTIANPARIHYFGRSEGVLAKNDPIDAALIERFGNSKQPPADPPLCPEQIALSELLSHRQHLVESAKLLRTHLQQVLDRDVRKEIERSIAGFEKRLALINKKLREKVDANAFLKRRLEILISVKGIGLITALALLIRMPELGTLNRGQCAALAGLAPYDADSGTERGQRCIRGGRSEVRGALYMAALTAAHSNPVSKIIYQRLRAAQKPYKVAITAVMRKLLIHLNACLKAPTVATA